jgi:hypothetical protein
LRLPERRLGQQPGGSRLKRKEKQFGTQLNGGVFAGFFGCYAQVAVCWFWRGGRRRLRFKKTFGG